MKKLGFLILLMLAAGPVAAQDASPAPAADEAIGFGTGEDSAAEADAAAADVDAVEADATAAETPAEAPMDESADAAADAVADDSADAAAEVSTDDAAAAEETVSVEETADAGEAADDSMASAAEESEPWQLYVGTDYVWTRARFSDGALESKFGGDDFDSSMVRARIGMRLFENIGLEAHLGAGTDDADSLEADEYSTEMFYGAYFVPTGVLFDLIEVAATIGYASTKLETATASETLSGVSFGVNLEVPLYSSDAVELRIGGGGTMFRAQNSAQISGYHAGIRVDFRI